MNFESWNEKWTYESYESFNLSSAIHQAIDSMQMLIGKAQVIAKNIFEQIKAKVNSTPLEPIIEKIIHIGTDVEKGFNLAGCLPFVCIISGTIGVLAGKLQVIAGIVVATIGELGLFLSAHPRASSEMREKWRVLSKLGTEHIIHGCLNILRRSGEVLLGSFTFGLGNLILLAPNLNCRRNFSPFFGYGTLVRPIKPSPLLQSIPKTQKGVSS